MAETDEDTPGPGETAPENEVAAAEVTAEPQEVETTPDNGLGFEFEGAAELEQVDALIGRAHFGVGGDHIAPFSRQLRKAMRDDFPSDNDIHDIADKAIADVQVGYGLMRVSTFLAYVILMVVLSSTIHAGYPEMQNLLVWGVLVELMAQLPGVGSNSELVYAYAAFGLVVFAGLRVVIRALFKREIEINGEKFAYKVKSRYDDIMSRMDKCTRNALLESDNWAKRASLWTKIALWCSKRSEYLDRYATTVGWKARFTIKMFHIISLGAKIAIGTYVCFTIAVSLYAAPDGSLAVHTDLFRVIAALVAIPALIYSWAILHWFPGDIWTEKFAKLVEDESAATGNYFDDISDMVESFVRTISASRFNGGQRNS
ncbi:hypothetical protein [Maricaulis salignorans]|uniref:Uncharacterized protein n=1 Tax=Maricaulis salignorans TaxID=144026 RepID=A0A1G9U6D8_9PROT|nr:hypothetical protein [Maricaulis salignorans]SDM55234.1 hypothetical protein SAMN04488568_1143 [Maricaulis salignorans]